MNLIKNPVYITSVEDKSTFSFQVVIDKDVADKLEQEKLIWKCSGTDCRPKYCTLYHLELHVSLEDIAKRLGM